MRLHNKGMQVEACPVLYTKSHVVFPQEIGWGYTRIQGEMRKLGSPKISLWTIIRLSMARYPALGQYGAGIVYLQVSQVFFVCVGEDLSFVSEKIAQIFFRHGCMLSF